MLLRPIILVAALARAVELDWIAQFSVEDKTFTAAGDVVFSWTGTHNVEKMTSFDAWESCDFSDAALLGDVFAQLKRPASTADVKARVESLIEREYLERDPRDAGVYNYLA